MTALQRIAGQYRLKVRLDECGDPIIPGRRGHLYFDGPSLCLMVTDGPIMLKSRWEALGGKLWLGDKSDYFQDVKITGLPEESIKAAIRMLGIKVRRIPSEAELSRLARIRPRPLQERNESALKSIAKAPVISEAHPGEDNG